MKAWQYRGISTAERVAARTICAQTGCHEFTGQKNTGGYGQVKDGARYVLVHRWAWEQANGPIPTGMCVCHRCDNPACVALEHLFLGTHADNMRDKKAKGRSRNIPSGAAHARPQAKIDAQVASDIKSYIAQGVRQCDVAKFLGVSRNLVSEIHLGKTWAHVT